MAEVKYGTEGDVDIMWGSYKSRQSLAGQEGRNWESWKEDIVIIRIQGLFRQNRFGLDFTIGKMLLVKGCMK